MAARLYNQEFRDSRIQVFIEEEDRRRMAILET